MLQNRWLLVSVLAGLMGPMSFTTLRAAEFRSGEKKLTVASEEVVEDDLYIAGQDVVIDGTIKGDLFVAGQSVTINGTVEGNVFAAGQSVIVKGTVKGDLFAAGQGVSIEGRVEDDARVAGQILKVSKSGYVAGDLFGAGMSLECEEGSTITTDMVVGAMQALLAGSLGRNLYGGVENCQIDGEVGGNVRVETGNGDALPPQTFQQLPPGFSVPHVAGGLHVGKDAKIRGKLTYTSVREADIADPAAVTGGVEHIAVAPRAAGAPPPKPTPLNEALSRLKGMAAVAVFGLLTVLLIPRWTTEMAANIRHRIWLSIVAGIVGFVGFIVVMLALGAVTIVAMMLFGSIGLDDLTLASLGLGLFGGVTLAGLLWFGLSFLAPTVVCVFIGRIIGRSPGFPTIAAFLIGLVLVAILWAIPSAGWLIATAMVTLGFGAFCVWLVAGPPPEVPVPATSAATATAKR